jgi:hypothetical protein
MTYHEETAVETTRSTHARLVKAWAYGIPIQYRYLNSDEWMNWYRPFCPVWSDELRFRIKPGTVFTGNFTLF